MEATRHLTPTERHIRLALMDGMTYKQIAAMLGVTVDTVRRHGSHIMRKERTASITALACVGIDLEQLPIILTVLPSNDPLTKSELTVLVDVCRGLSAKQIARERATSSRTVEKQKQMGMRKLHVRSAFELTELVHRQYANHGIDAAISRV